MTLHQAKAAGRIAVPEIDDEDFTATARQRRQDTRTLRPGLTPAEQRHRQTLEVEKVAENGAEEKEEKDEEGRKIERGGRQTVPTT